MESWTLAHESPNTGRTYTRPLGTTELFFYWDSRLNGTSDIVRHSFIEVNNQNECEPFAIRKYLDSIESIWIRLKQRFPLLGAHFEEQGDDRRKVNVVVNDIDLERLGPGELEFGNVSSDKEVHEFMEQLMNGERRLSNKLLARLFILIQDDHHFHLLFHATHCIADGVSNLSVIQILMEELASPNHGKTWNLEERLALAMAPDSLSPIMKQSRAKQRWHRAIGRVIWSLRQRKLVGGHTLPRTCTTLSKFIPAISSTMRRSFNAGVSAIIMKNCKKLGLTFGSVLPVLGQVALARSLCRQYIQGKISTEEWEFRRKEPMVTAGPVNLRPFLDKRWFDDGGSNNVCLAISLFLYRMPFMPLGTASRIAPGDELPAYSELLSLGRFVLRSKSIRKQATELFDHPLFLEIISARLPEREQSGREIALTWEKASLQCHGADPIPITEQSRGGFVLSHGGSSMGNIDKMLPRSYSGPHVKIKVCQSTGVFRCMPMEVHLKSSTFDNELSMDVYWDKNSYDELIIAEWLEDIMEATKYYLGAGAD